jgi:hypothetical protein
VRCGLPVRGVEAIAGVCVGICAGVGASASASAGAAFTGVAALRDTGTETGTVKVITVAVAGAAFVTFAGMGRASVLGKSVRGADEETRGDERVADRAKAATLDFVDARLPRVCPKPARMWRSLPSQRGEFMSCVTKSSHDC